MKRLLIIIPASVLVIACHTAFAATADHSSMFNSLSYSDDLTHWSFGADMLLLKRDINPDGGDTEKLKGRMYTLSLGYDVLPWLTMYGHLGQGEAKVGDAEDYGDGKWCWGIGVDGNLWQFEIIDPQYIAGLFSLKASLSYGQYRSGDSDNEVKWDEIYAGILFTYQIEAIENLFLMPHSLVLSVGPCYSRLSGTLDMLSGSMDFDAEENWGYTAGADVYLSPNLSMGFHVQGQGSSPINGLELSVTDISLRYRY